MPVKRGFASRRRHKRRLQMAEGFRGRRGSCFKHAKLGVEKATKYAYRDRRAKKRDLRSLWIVRINAASRLSGLTYSRLILGLRNAKIEVDRKILADMAFSDMTAFAAIAEKAKAAL